MKFIKVYQFGEGCQIPDNKKYLLVSASQVDASGEWVSDSIQTFDNQHQVREALRPIVTSGDGVVIRGSDHFERLAQELGLPRLISEWGCL